MKDNFTPNPSEDRGPQDLTLLIEQHAKEVWALKQELSKASEEITVLRGTKDVVTRLSNELVRMKKRVEEADATIVELRQRINELMAISKSHQNLMGKQIVENEELKKDNKALAKQIDDYFNARLDSVRKSGI